MTHGLPLPLLLLACAAHAWAADPLRVLFIGNSLTNSNDLPEMVATLAAAGGQLTLIQDSYTSSGKSLEDHWKEGKALVKIQAKKWDYVVLQGHSNEAIACPEDTRTYGALFNEAIAKQGSKTIWFMTWAHREHPDQQPLITKAYTDIAAAMHGTLAPVGQAWGAIRATDPGIELFIDRKHPTKAGTYLAACVFYSILYRTTPVGLPGRAGKLDPLPAKALQEAAWAAVEVIPAVK